MLKQIKRKITKQKRRAEYKEEINILAFQIKLVDEYLFDLQQKRQNHKIQKIVANLKTRNGIHNHNVWEFRKQIEKKNHTTCSVAMKKKNGELEEDPQKIFSMFAEYYEDLLTTRKAETLEEIKAEEHVEMLKKGRQMLVKKETPEAITLEELDKVIKTLKKKKSPDLEGWRMNGLKREEKMSGKVR